MEVVRKEVGTFVEWDLLLGPAVELFRSRVVLIKIKRSNFYFIFFYELGLVTNDFSA